MCSLDTLPRAPPPPRAYDLAPFDWNRIAAQTRDVFERAAAGRVLRTT